MAWIRCERGEHIYDSEKYSSCPFCRQVGEGIAPTVDVKVPTSDAMANWHDGKNPPPIPGGQATEGMPLSGGAGKTIGFFAAPESKDKIFDPVVGWVVVISTVNRGQDYRLRAGYNMVGRDTKSDIFIDFDSKISRQEHAAVIYDPKNSSFFVQHMKGHNATYLNGTILLQPAILKPYDVITIGDTQLLFIPLCGSQFHWDEENNARNASIKNVDTSSELANENDNS